MIEEILHKTRELIEEKNFKEAKINLKKVLNPDKENPYIHYFLGYVYSALGNTRSGIKHFYIALNKGLAYTDIYQELGRLHFELNEYKKAIKNLIILNSDEPLILYMIGKSYFNIEKFQECIKFFKKSIALGLSEKYRDKALDIVALSYCKIKKFNSAEKILREGINFSPDYPDHYELLGKILISRMDYRRAREVFNEELKLNYSPDVLFHIALTYIIENKLNIAVNKLKEILRKWENHRPSQYALEIIEKR